MRRQSQLDGNMARRPATKRWRSVDPFDILGVYRSDEFEHCGGVREQMEIEMKEEIARLRAHHIEDLRPIVMTVEALADDIKGLLRRWEAELNPADEEPAERFEPPITPKRVE